MIAAPRLSQDRVLVAALMLLAALVGALAGVKPAYGLGAAFGLAFLGAVISDLTAGLCLFTIVSFMDLLSSNNGLSLSKFAGLLLVVSWVGTLLRRERREKEFVSAYPGLTYLAALFLAWAALSYVWAEAPGQVASGWYRYALNILLLPVVYSAARNRRSFVFVIVAFVAGSVISDIYGLISPGGVASEADLVRETGTIGDANELASVLVAAFILAAALAVAVKRAPLARLGALFVAGVCIYGTFATLSRGGLIALAVALVAAALFGGRWRPVVIVCAVVVALAGVTYFEFIASPEARTRVTSTADKGSGRSDIWTVAWRMVQAHSVDGVGVGNFQAASIHYLLQPGQITRSDLILDQPKVAHNTYLQELSELGVVGLALFLSIIGFVLSCVYRAAREFERKRDLRMELLARALLVAMIGFLAADFFISDQYSKQLWLLLALGPPLLAVARSARPVSVSGGRSARWAASPGLTENQGVADAPALAAV